MSKREVHKLNIIWYCTAKISPMNITNPNLSSYLNLSETLVILPEFLKTWLYFLWLYFKNQPIPPFLYTFLVAIPKGTVFFFSPAKVHFIHTFGKNRLNEWKRCFFFFSGDGKKKKQPRDRLSEWHMNFFFGKKKKYSKIMKKWAVFFFSGFLEKKKKQNFGFWMNEWAMNFRAEIKKYGTFDEGDLFFSKYLS